MGNLQTERPSTRVNVQAKRSRAELPLLIFFFAMLWLPLGQRVFLLEHWMKIGAYLTPMILFFAVRENFLANKPLLSDRRMMTSLLTSIYLVHQIEEYWVDLLGRVYLAHTHPTWPR